MKKRGEQRSTLIRCVGSMRSSQNNTFLCDGLSGHSLSLARIGFVRDGSLSRLVLVAQGRTSVEEKSPKISAPLPFSLTPLTAEIFIADWPLFNVFALFY